MTSFDTDLASRGWALISEGAQMISLAYAANDSPVARAGVAGAEGAKAPQPSSVPALPSFDELPPEGFNEAPAQLKPQVDAGLGICPIHGKRWTVKPAGVSKAGKPYSAFYKCAERDENGYCNEKPQRIWQDTHPIPEGAAA